MKTFYITTEKLWKNYLNTIGDTFWHNGPDMCEEYEFLKQHIRALTCEEIDGIRKMFKEGYTVFMLNGNIVDYLNEHGAESVEMRIWNRQGNYIGSIVGKELNF